MKTINNQQAQTEYVHGNAIIIDVREPAEFAEIHIPGAINIPSTQFDAHAFEPFLDRKVCIICQTGKRSRNIIEKLESMHWNNVYYLETQMENYQHTVAQKTSGWTVDRQFRFLLGILLSIYVVTYFLGAKGFIVIPMILGTGLIVTALINRCYLRIGIAKLPWNRGKAE